MTIKHFNHLLTNGYIEKIGKGVRLAYRALQAKISNIDSETPVYRTKKLAVKPIWALAVVHFSHANKHYYLWRKT